MSDELEKQACRLEEDKRFIGLRAKSKTYCVGLLCSVNSDRFNTLPPIVDPAGCLFVCEKKDSLQQSLKIRLLKPHFLSDQMEKALLSCIANANAGYLPADTQYPLAADAKMSQ